MTIYLPDGTFFGKWLIPNPGNHNLALQFLGDSIMIWVFGVCNPNKPSENKITKIICVDLAKGRSVISKIKKNPVAYVIFPTQRGSCCSVVPYNPMRFELGIHEENKWITDSELKDGLLGPIFDEIEDQTQYLGRQVYRDYWTQCMDMMIYISLYKTGEYVVDRAKVSKIKINISKFRRNIGIIEYSFIRFIRRANRRK